MLSLEMETNYNYYIALKTTCLMVQKIRPIVLFFYSIFIANVQCLRNVVGYHFLIKVRFIKIIVMVTIKDKNFYLGKLLQFLLNVY